MVPLERAGVFEDATNDIMSCLAIESGEARGARVAPGTRAAITGIRRADSPRPPRRAAGRDVFAANPFTSSFRTPRVTLVTVRTGIGDVTLLVTREMASLHVSEDVGKHSGRTRECANVATCDRTTLQSPRIRITPRKTC